MTLVVDASVAFKWFFVAEPNASQALAILADDEPTIAPEILIAEVCNAAWRSVRLGRIDEGELPKIAAVLPRHFAELTELAMLAPRAVMIARQLDHPVYDCFYVALAELRQTIFVTADERLLAKLKGSAWEAASIPLERYSPAG